MTQNIALHIFPPYFPDPRALQTSSKRRVEWLLVPIYALKARTQANMLQVYIQVTVPTRRVASAWNDKNDIRLTTGTRTIARVRAELK